MTSLLRTWHMRYCSLSLWERVGVRAGGLQTRTAIHHGLSALIPAFSQREKEQSRRYKLGTSVQGLRAPAPLVRGAQS
jgi:hypothetical protein